MQTSSLNLVRSSHSWTEADSAAGFVLRYLSPMRKQLTSTMGSDAEADECLKLLLAHLVAAGFGDFKQGRLRDFLIRGVRSSAKARLAEMPEPKRAKINLDPVTSESQQWLQLWAECLTERAWRALERQEHTDRKSPPYYSILKMFGEYPKATTAQLVAAVTKEAGREVDQQAIDRGLTTGRTLLAQFIADEVVATLQNATKEDVKSEIVHLGLQDAFNGMKF